MSTSSAMTSRSPPPDRRGFTLLEMLVVLALLTGPRRAVPDAFFDVGQNDPHPLLNATLCHRASYSARRARDDRNLVSNLSHGLLLTRF